MRRRTIETAAVLLAAGGLVVSLAEVWPRLGDALPVEPGHSVTAPVVTPEGARVPGDWKPEGRRSPGTERTRHERPPIRTTDARRVRPTAAKVLRAVRLSIPTGGIDAPVRPVGVTADGLMELPPKPTVLGWYRFGPAPGAGVGSVVVAGHLDSTRYGIGPLVGLREVEVGDPVAVTRVDGSRRRYTVIDVRRYDRRALPAELFARAGPERLRIVTCGGEYRADEGGYQQNLVVTAAPG